MLTMPVVAAAELRLPFHRVLRACRGWLLAALCLAAAGAAQAGSTVDLDNANGLPDAQLGAPLKNFTGLKQTEDTGRWLSYIRPSDQLAYAGHEVKSITYNFFKEKLYSIFVEVEGGRNVKGLYKTLETQYGKEHNFELQTYGKTATQVGITEWAGTKVYCIYKCAVDNKGAVLTFLDKPTWDQLQIPKKEKEAQSREMLKGSYIDGNF